MRSKLGLDKPCGPVTMCDNEIGALLRRTITILTAILALSAIGLPAFADFNEGTPGSLVTLDSAVGVAGQDCLVTLRAVNNESVWTGNVLQARSAGMPLLSIFGVEDEAGSEPSTSGRFILPADQVDAVLIFGPEGGTSLEATVKVEDCQPPATTTTTTTTTTIPGPPMIVFPPPPGTGWVCVGSDNVITEVPRDSNPLVTIWDTPEEAQASCPTVAELPTISVEAPTTTEATVLPFTGIGNTPALLIAALGLLSLGGILVRSVRSDG